MRCPFPGMDPFIERPAIWSDFHDSLIAEIRRELQPLLRPKYVAVSQERLYVVESDRPIYPDVSVSRVRPGTTGGDRPLPPLEPDSRAVFKLDVDEVREPVIHIVDPANEQRIVTAIEVLSPGNKTRGAGRRSYLRKRRELWGARANIIEIDLLRAGRRTVRVPREQLARLRPWAYVVAATLRRHRRLEVYPVPLGQRLPRVAVPLGADDLDVVLDLQAAFTRCWDDGPYPGLLRYDGPPPGGLTDDELAWIDTTLKAAGHRPAVTQ